MALATWIVAVLLAAHGLIHLMGFAKAFGYAELPQLTQPVSHEMGVAWLAAALLVVASAVVMVAWPRSVAGGHPVGVVRCEGWYDRERRLTAGVGTGLVQPVPQSFRARFERDVEAGLARPSRHLS